MNLKALINRFLWPGLPFFARINIKPCQDFDLTTSSDSISTLLSPSSKLLSYSSTWLKSAVDSRVSIGYKTQHGHIGSNRVHLRGSSGCLFNLVSWKEDLDLNTLPEEELLPYL